MHVQHHENANGGITLVLMNDQGAEVSRQWMSPDMFETFQAFCALSNPVAIYHEFAQGSWASEAA